ncbi:MAG TPA: hypothetical protein VFU96_02235, partial [Acidimicrobiia bacterium]|nr:hypothetical protein [Acidimicrobiia bacterium]
YENEAADARAKEVTDALVELIPLWFGASPTPGEEGGTIWHDRHLPGDLAGLVALVEKLQENDGPLVGLEMHSAAANTLDADAYDVGDLHTWQLLATIAGRPLPEAMPPKMDLVEYYDRYVHPGIDELAERAGRENFDRDRARRRMLGDDAPPPQEYEQ